jgi:hypothetical protein
MTSPLSAKKRLLIPLSVNKLQTPDCRYVSPAYCRANPRYVHPADFGSVISG